MLGCFINLIIFIGTGLLYPDDFICLTVGSIDKWHPLSYAGWKYSKLAGHSIMTFPYLKHAPPRYQSTPLLLLNVFSSSIYSTYSSFSSIPYINPNSKYLLYNSSLIALYTQSDFN